MTVGFVLCADDFGMSESVSRAICSLLSEGRLSATSCMAIAPSWPEHAVWLRAVETQPDIGLHLTLTEYEPLGPMPHLAANGILPTLPKLMSLALSRRLDRDEIARELHRQLDRFKAAFERPPDFIDGHQHVHQLPIIRDVVLDVLTHRLEGKAYVRTCWDDPATIVRHGVSPAKTLLIAALGTRFRRAVRSAGLMTNEYFRGVYAFSAGMDYPNVFARFLRDLRPGMLMMCHPGRASQCDTHGDPIAVQRVAEYSFMSGEELPAALARANAAIVPLRSMMKSR